MTDKKKYIRSLKAQIKELNKLYIETQNEEIENQLNILYHQYQKFYQ